MDLLVFGLSHHFNEPEPDEPVAEYREFNPGLGLQWYKTDEDGFEPMLTVAIYQNSLDRPTVAFGPGIRSKGNLGLEASVVLATGYYDIPVLVPVAGVFYSYKSVTVHVAYMQAAVLYIGVKL